MVFLFIMISKISYSDPSDSNYRIRKEKEPSSFLSKETKVQKTDSSCQCEFNQVDQQTQCQVNMYPQWTQTIDEMTTMRSNLYK